MAQESRLLHRFLAEEADAQVRSMLLASIAEASSNGRIEHRLFEFNVFDVGLDFKTGVATLSDVLSATDQEHVLLPAFKAALEQSD